MRILLLTLDFFPQIGGVQRYLYEIAHRLGQTHTVTVITPVRGPEHGFHRIVLSPHRLDEWIKVARALRPHWVLVGHAHPRLLLVAALVGRKYVTFTYGNDFLAAQTRWHRALFNALLRRSTYVITISDTNVERLRAFGLSRIRVVYPGTNPCRFSPPSQPLSAPPWILLSVGRLVPRKGIDTVIQALPALPHTVHYHVVGDGPDKKRLQEIVVSYNLSNRVNFLGRVSEEHLPQVYKRAHIFVLPSREEREGQSVEGFGIVYLEAAASGLPVIASTATGIADLIQQRRVGLLVPPNNPHALADVIRRLLKDHALRHELAHAGRVWVEREMNWSRTATAVLETLTGS